jgi:hypothetical protein
MNQRGFILPSPSLIMAGVIVALSLSNATFIYLYRGAANDAAKHKATLVAERKQAKADAEKAQLAAERVTADLQVAHAAALADLKRTPVVRVLRNTVCVSNTNAGSSGGSDATLKPPPVDTGAITPAECEIYLNRGLEDALNYEWLMHWIRTEQEALK